MVRKITKDEHKTKGGISSTHYDEEEGDFVDNTIVAVHCEDDEEAREVARVVSDVLGSNSDKE